MTLTSTVSTRCRAFRVVRSPRNVRGSFVQGEVESWMIVYPNGEKDSVADATDHQLSELITERFGNKH